MKIIVAGGRDFIDKERMKKEISQLVENGDIPEYLELVCGMAKGADLTAKDLFDEVGFVVHERPAGWDDMSKPCVVGVQLYGSRKKYNKLAGMKRNHAMGDEADLLVAFHDKRSKGTADMIKYMKSLGKPVHVFYY